jgi:chromosome segregation ATPase
MADLDDLRAQFETLTAARNARRAHLARLLNAVAETRTGIRALDRRIDETLQDYERATASRP